jgi:hypothetical protein
VPVDDCDFIEICWIVRAFRPPAPPYLLLQSQSVELETCLSEHKQRRLNRSLPESQQRPSWSEFCGTMKDVLRECLECLFQHLINW